MHSDPLKQKVPPVNSDSSKTSDETFKKVVKNERQNMLEVQHAKIATGVPQEKQIDMTNNVNNLRSRLSSSTPYSGINQPIFETQLTPPLLQQQFQPHVGFNQQLLEAPLPTLLMQLNSQHILKYDKNLDATMVDLPKAVPTNGLSSAYTLKDLEASGMNKAFDGVDTSGLPDELVDKVKLGRGATQDAKNKNMLSTLDNMFMKMLDHNSHGKDMTLSEFSEKRDNDY